MNRKYILLCILCVILIFLIIYLVLFCKISVVKSNIKENVSSNVKIVHSNLIIEIKSFKQYQKIPEKYTCDGIDINPEIIIKKIPNGTKSLAIIMYDPDAPTGTFYHWLLYNIPPNVTKIPEGLPKTFETKYGYQGINDFGKIGYNGPCPPKGHGIHHYHFVVIALNVTLPVKHYKASEFYKIIKKYIITTAEYIGIYSR